MQKSIIVHTDILISRKTNDGRTVGFVQLNRSVCMARCCVETSLLVLSLPVDPKSISEHVIVLPGRIWEQATFSNKLKLKWDELWILLFHYLGFTISQVRKCSPQKYLSFNNRLPSAMYFDLKATESSSMRQPLVISNKKWISFGLISDSICPAAAVVGYPGVAHATKGHQPPM